MNYISYKGVEYKSGDSIIFRINDGLINRGKLFIKPKGKYDTDYYINAYVCHNNPDNDGSILPDKLGYEYSCAFSIDNREQNPFEYSDVKIICHDIDVEDKENVEMSSELKIYLETQELESVESFFERGTIFEKYNKIELSEKTGYVKLTNTTTKRFVDIKFGRFLTTLFKEIKESYIELEYQNKDIERFYNCFVAYQTNTSTEILELKGDEILEGYKLENYLLEKSSLGGSCMTDKLDNIKLYTLNPNIISLLVIKLYGKIAGRCLIWNTEQGKVMDKRYTCFDWIDSKFDNILKERGYTCYSSLEEYPNCKKVDIVLDNVDVDMWPYVDTFKFFDKENTIITNNIHENMEDKNTDDENSRFIQLTRTEGNYYYFDNKGDLTCSEDLDDDFEEEESHIDSIFEDED